MEIIYTIDVMLSVGMGVGQSGGRNLLVSFVGVQTFLRVWCISGALQNLENLQFLDSVVTALGLIVNWSSGGKKIIYSLFCIFIIIIIFSSICFVVLLNCLYLNPQVLLFVHFSSPCCLSGRGERVAAWCLVASCQVRP